MVIRINSSECIGCGVCAQICPEVFEIDENEGKSAIISQQEVPSLKEAIDSCPVSAISAE